ncbi:MAG: metallophosphoesterase [Oscillospiraceae bacterium]|nr:metallophosphoesterase [Oscillospiraceae bacterium]
MQETFYKVNIPFKAALIADLHDQPYDAVLASLRRRQPGMIFIPGDLIYGTVPPTGLKIDKTHVLPFLEHCAEIAPTFFSLGNHEWMLRDEDLARIEKTGASVLDNRWLVSNGIAVGGLSSGRHSEYRKFCEACPTEPSTLMKTSNPLYPYMEFYAYLNKVTPRLNWLCDFEAFDGYKLLLSHHPEYYPLCLKDRKIDLILSGHAHGGQWRFFGRGLFAPGQGLFPKLTSGVVDGRLVISRGLANMAPVPRLFNPPELVYLLPE